MSAQIITVTSGKGGVGKTTVTANLASALAMLGKRVTTIDADIGLRNLDVVMGLENRIVYDLVDVVEGPYRLRGTQTYELEPRGLGLSLSVSNTGNQPVPVGIGIHPWFRSAPVSIPAERRWPGEPMPTGRPVRVAGRYDLRGGTLPEPMDCCFTALTATTARVGDLELTWEGPVTDVVVFSGVSGWVCVEPVTMANGAFGLSPGDAAGYGGRFLSPGKSLAVTYRFDALT